MARPRSGARPFHRPRRLWRVRLTAPARGGAPPSRAVECARGARASSDALVGPSAPAARRLGRSRRHCGREHRGGGGEDRAPLPVGSEEGEAGSEREMPGTPAGAGARAPFRVGRRQAGGCRGVLRGPASAPAGLARPPAGRGAPGAGAPVTSVTAAAAAAMFPLPPHPRGAAANPVSVTRGAVAEPSSCCQRGGKGPAGRGAPRGWGVLAIGPSCDPNGFVSFSVNALAVNPRGKAENGAAVREAASIAEATALGSRK